jgi:hypothetical protein
MADRKVYINNGTAVVQVGAGVLSALGDVTITSPTNGQSLSYNGTAWVNATGAGTGTVTSVSVVSANGLAGTVATATTTPAITLTTSVTGLVKGNGTALSAATSGTDYSAGTSALGTGIVKSTTTTGALTIAVAGDFPTLNQNTTGTAANVTGTVAIANGGTGATSAAAALTALGAYPSSNPSGYTSNAGTVTSVAALTLGTTGTDLSSTVATGTTTPVITLQVPTASATNRGALSAADWTTFNNKQAALGFTPYNATNPSGYIALASAITGYTVGTNTALAATDTLLAGLGKIQGQINARGTGNGTVTSVSGTGTVSGLTLTGTVTGSGSLTLGGTIATLNQNTTGSSGSCTGNAATATYATTAGSAPANGGTATALNSSNYISQHGSDGGWNADFQNTPAGTTRYNGDVGANTTQNPGNTWWIQQNFRHTNASNYWGTQVAWGWEDNANRLATRNVTGGTFGAWVYYLNSANFTSYAPSLTGSGASGTWGINVSGTANSETLATVTSRGNVATQYLNVPAGDGNGFCFWNDTTNYKISMGVGSLYQYGTVTDYSIKMQMDAGSTGRGFTWGRAGITPVAGINSTSGNFQTAGTIAAAGTITAYYSDERLKTKLGKIDNALSKVESLDGFYYEANEVAQALGYEVKREVGVSAQQVQKILPEIIAPAPIDNQYLTVHYERLVPLLIEAIKELKIEVDKLKGLK